MTKKIITSYSALLCVAVLMTGYSTVHASEVTGTLSSNAASDLTTTGSLEGTVRAGSGGSSSGGGGSRSDGSRGRSLSSTPDGLVLGATTDNSTTPGFPNAGVSPEVSSVNQTLWLTVETFFRKIFSF